ncbi:sensor histidine kinase [Clostridium butyricum]|mgnify:CR=1 FL=1|uniref:histidine kinase n=1 Tax=Clostridium butyricum E4 str. BoNT E BL5262 TaxID=632245 RepID=C4IM05_CLOBU|nr:HAMP domain-containing sensor histidine kinase [Clostridium butyricum]APF23478.1 his Kinase A domain protein [Clostridium butyricum]EDT74698.1 sensor protein ResE [Clostridium butyricum 5521]EEP52743.1 sensor histidine kinase [Clostridium butyricum E4 str. BoNT E BL5262]NFL29975.1 HAMP domain-containing histidine kinase [Clostridium butyricum]NFS17418.1 HAMP domain-containing histidine kinase [Clostridium butyricum]
MKILVNRKIKKLFSLVLLLILAFTLISVTLIILNFKNVALCIFVCSLCMSISIMVIIYRYFKEENIIMENAVTQIKEYISGNQNAHIECNDEGELYRLFHEVNSIVSILNAHAENEAKSKKFLKDIISDISHQLKTPLAALNIYNGIMQEETKSLPTIKEFTTLSEQELDKIEILVQNLLKITKLDAGTIVIEKAKENVSEIMSSIEKHFSFRAKQEEKQIYFSGDDDITLLCDCNWLIEAISNIIKNAFDHTKKGNTIHIEWKQFASIIQIIIKDNGCGIHQEDLHHIFKRFYRSRFSKDTQGIGLGLSLAKAIVEAHSGTIEVHSQLGIGTTFTINFLYKL